jgi:hypothetical protein
MAADLAATGPDPTAVDAAREGIRELFGFLYSTPAYWPSLDLYGWGDVGPELREMTRQGRWKEMPGRISDEMLEVLVPCGTYDEIADILRARFAGVATRITFPIPEDVVWDARVAEIIAALGGHDR